MKEFNEAELKKDLMLEAKALDIPVGSAEIFIKHTIRDAKKSLKNKKIITKADLERAVTRELKKYNQDLAYVYANRDKII